LQRSGGTWILLAERRDQSLKAGLVDFENGIPSPGFYAELEGKGQVK
jgi:hypothetical protein